VWVDRYAEALGVEAPSDDEVADLLALAGVAAHASHRTAAPVSSWLAARAPLTLAQALDTARALADQLGREAGRASSSPGSPP
jgi:hypothetical protein